MLHSLLFAASIVAAIIGSCKTNKINKIIIVDFIDALIFTSPLSFSLWQCNRHGPVHIIYSVYHYHLSYYCYGRRIPLVIEVLYQVLFVPGRALSKFVSICGEHYCFIILIISVPVPGIIVRSNSNF